MALLQQNPQACFFQLRQTCFIGYKSCRRPLWASCRSVQKELQDLWHKWFTEKEYLHDWTKEKKKDLHCQKCTKFIAGVVRWQTNGPHHYGCMTYSFSWRVPNRAMHGVVCAGGIQNATEGPGVRAPRLPHPPIPQSTSRFYEVPSPGSVGGATPLKSANFGKADEASRV